MNTTDTTTDTTATEVATIAPTATEVATIAPAHAIQWQTKKGATKTAYTEVSAIRAPRAARLEAAQEKTLAQLNAGQFRPFIRDTVQSLNAAQLKGLHAHVLTALSTIVDGVPMAPVGDAFATPNKKLVSAVADWLLAPYAMKKVGKGKSAIDVSEPVTLKGVAADLAGVAVAYVAGM